mgnify:CR=1 FL=1
MVHGGAYLFYRSIGGQSIRINDQVGPGVEGIIVGQRYCTLPYFYDNAGTSADFAVVDARYITPAPEGLSAVEATSVWMQYMTAFYPVIDISKGGPGTNILATAGTSTAGTAALLPPGCGSGTAAAEHGRGAEVRLIELEAIPGAPPLGEELWGLTET